MTVQSLAENEINDEDLQKKLNECLHHSFKKMQVNESIVSVFLHKDRANLHLKSVTSSGAWHGFKRWTTAQDCDGGEEGCAERDLLMNKFAKLLKLPNYCEVHHSRKLAHPDLFELGHPVCISAWMQQSKSFNKFSKKDWINIIEDGENFFNQFGQWLTFGVCMDFRDWTSNNFVWSQTNSTLAMIDFDWSLGGGMDAKNSFHGPLDDLRDLSEWKGCDFRAQLASGIVAMQEKIRTNSELIEKDLAAATKFVPLKKLVSTQTLMDDYSAVLFRLNNDET